MNRLYIVLLCLALPLVDASEANARTRRRGTCCRVQCAPRCTTAASQRDSSRVDSCICLKDALETYPTATPGVYETLYLAELNNDGCKPDGNCQYPETIYVVSGPGQDPQDCNVNYDCMSKYRMKASSGLGEPVPIDHEPKFPGDLGDVAEPIHTDYVTFQAPGRDWVRAIVHIVKLPLDTEIRPGQPERMVAYGFEVKDGALPNPPYVVDHRYVRKTANSSLFMLDCGGVTYAVVLTAGP